MPITLDEELVQPAPAQAQTLGNAMAWVNARLRDTGKVVVKVEVGGRPLDGPEMDEAHPSSLFAAYALHALPPEETAAVEEYLTAHPDAAHEVAMLKEAAAMLPIFFRPAATRRRCGDRPATNWENR